MGRDTPRGRGRTLQRGRVGCCAEWGRGAPPPHAKELWAIACVHKRLSAPKRKEKMGSSVAYKTAGAFLSKGMRHEDASRQAANK